MTPVETKKYQKRIQRAPGNGKFLHGYAEKLGNC